ncbi:MAG: hypothetical protein M3Q22_15555, partial [Actinomycetota bacterium]|nr:hypothetical protein [Actinomycetota bacterium]
MSQPSHSNNPLAVFGPNEWLVDEMYQQYQRDPESVDRAWWDFFADYDPEAADGEGNGQTSERATGAPTNGAAVAAGKPNGSPSAPTATASPSAAATDDA